MFFPQTQGLLRYYMVFLLFAFFQQNSGLSSNLTKTKEINGVLCENGFLIKTQKYMQFCYFCTKNHEKTRG